jgi:hypothetical protein
MQLLEVKNHAVAFPYLQVLFRYWNFTYLDLYSSDTGLKCQLCHCLSPQSIIYVQFIFSAGNY